MIKKIIILIVLLLPAVIQGQNKSILYQYSVITSLLEGNYEGELTIGELLKHGNFGLGTLNMLDGEMIILNGQGYQINDKGIVKKVDNSVKTPFAAVTHFKPDEEFDVDVNIKLDELLKMLDNKMAASSIMYAVKIDGIFAYVKTRSVPKQQKPYKRLVEVTRTQSEFEFNNVKGTIAGFRIPQYMDGVNVPGYHFHFLAEGETGGGHILDLTCSSIKIQISGITNLSLILPENKDFFKLKINNKNTGELEEAERK